MNDEKIKKTTETLFGKPNAETENKLLFSAGLAMVLYLFLDHCKKQPDPWKFFNDFIKEWRDTNLAAMAKQQAELDKIDILKVLGNVGLFQNINEDWIKNVNAVVSKIEDAAKLTLPPRKDNENGLGKN